MVESRDLGALSAMLTRADAGAVASSIAAAATIIERWSIGWRKAARRALVDERVAGRFFEIRIIGVCLPPETIGLLSDSPLSSQRNFCSNRGIFMFAEALHVNSLHFQ